MSLQTSTLLKRLQQNRLAQRSMTSEQGITNSKAKMMSYLSRLSQDYSTMDSQQYDSVPQSYLASDERLRCSNSVRQSSILQDVSHSPLMVQRNGDSIEYANSRFSQSDMDSANDEPEDFVKIQQVSHPVFVKPKVNRKKEVPPSKESPAESEVKILRAVSTSRMKMKQPKHKTNESLDQDVTEQIYYKKQSNGSVVSSRSLRPDKPTRRHRDRVIERPNNQIPMPISDPSEHESSIRENCADVYVQKLTASRSFVKTPARNVQKQQQTAADEYNEEEQDWATANFDQQRLDNFDVEDTLEPQQPFDTIPTASTVRNRRLQLLSDENNYQGKQYHNPHQKNAASTVPEYVSFGEGRPPSYYQELHPHESEQRLIQNNVDKSDSDYQPSPEEVQIIHDEAMLIRPRHVVQAKIKDVEPEKEKVVKQQRPKPVKNIKRAMDEYEDRKEDAKLKNLQVVKVQRTQKPIPKPTQNSKLAIEAVDPNDQEQRQPPAQDIQIIRTKRSVQPYDQHQEEEAFAQRQRQSISEQRTVQKIWTRKPVQPAEVELDFEQGDGQISSRGNMSGALVQQDMPHIDQQEYDQQKQEQQQLVRSLQVTNKQEIPITRRSTAAKEENSPAPQQMTRRELQQRRQRFRDEQEEPEIIDFAKGQNNAVVEEDRPIVDLDARTTRKPQGRVLRVNVSGQNQSQKSINPHDQQILDFFGIAD